MRRSAALLLLLALVLPLVSLGPSGAAEAQEREDVRLQLRTQTTSLTREQPLRMRLRAVNDSEAAFGDLAVRLSVYDAVGSRSEYEQSLEADLPTLFEVDTIDVPGRLEPGDSISIRIERSMRVLREQAENALFPLKLELTSHLEPLATLRTAVAFIGRRPFVPLNVSVTFVLDAPLVMGPAGVFRDDSLERSISPGGRLRTIVAALTDSPIATTLVVSPLLLQQLAAMRDGYDVTTGDGLRHVPAADLGAKRAAAMLEQISDLASRATTQVVAMPYAAPSVAALAEAGLQEELEEQLGRGRGLVEELLGPGAAPSETLVWPPRSELSPDAARALALAGVTTLAVDAETLPAAPSKFAPPATARLSTGLGQALRVVTPDPFVDALTSRLPEDPRLRAQWVLGELASIYFEHPSIDRGVSIVFDEDDAPEAPFVRRLLRGIASRTRPGWIRPVAAGRLLVPGLKPPPDRRILEAPADEPRFPPGFVTALRDARAAMQQLVSVVGDGSPIVGRLGTLILQSQSRSLLVDEGLPLEYLERVHEQVASEFAKVEPPFATPVTLTSQGGVIPVTVRNLAGYALRVRLTLESPRLEFLGGSSREVTLSRELQAFTFPVRAASTGGFPVVIRVETPLGEEISSTRIVVRSTAYNRVALAITIGAALFLAVLWGRRFLPRRR